LKKPPAAATLWGGRFSAPPAEALRKLNDSFGFDRALLPEDVAGSIAWAEALGRAKVLTPREKARLVKALRAIGAAGLSGIP